MIQNGTRNHFDGNSSQIWYQGTQKELLVYCLYPFVSVCIISYRKRVKDNKWYQKPFWWYVILFRFGTKVLKKCCYHPVSICLYQFVSICMSLYKFVWVCMSLYEFVSVCIISYRKSKIWYQMVPGTIFLVIFLSFGAKVLKNELMVYGFPCWYIIA